MYQLNMKTSFSLDKRAEMLISCQEKNTVRMELPVKENPVLL